MRCALSHAGSPRAVVARAWIRAARRITAREAGARGRNREEERLAERDEVPEAAGEEVRAVQYDADERKREVQGGVLRHQAPVREDVAICGIHAT